MFERILGLDPANATALVNLGALEVEQHQAALARRHFLRAIEVDPGSSPAHAGLGVAALKMGDPQEAIAHLKIAVSLDRTNYEALYNLAIVLTDTRDASARQYLELFTQSAPSSLFESELREAVRLLHRH